MALRLGFIGIVTRDMSASLAFYRLLGAPVPDGSDESHVDTRLEDGIVLAWDTIDLIRSLDPGYESPSGGHRIALAFDQGTVWIVLGFVEGWLCRGGCRGGGGVVAMVAVLGGGG